MASSTSKLERLISTGPAARKLGLSNQGLYLRAQAGKVPFVLISGRRFFDRDVIEKIAQREEAQ